MKSKTQFGVLICAFHSDNVHDYPSSSLVVHGIQWYSLLNFMSSCS